MKGSTRPSAVVLTIYSRSACKLCDEMLAALQTYRASRRFAIEVVLIDGEPDLERRYGLRIPVLMLGDRELCIYRVDWPRVEAALAGAFVLDSAVERVGPDIEIG